jgi:hypothetical protein
MLLKAYFVFFDVNNTAKFVAGILREEQFIDVVFSRLCELILLILLQLWQYSQYKRKCERHLCQFLETGVPLQCIDVLLCIVERFEFDDAVPELSKNLHRLPYVLVSLQIVKRTDV